MMVLIMSNQGRVLGCDPKGCRFNSQNNTTNMVQFFQRRALAQNVKFCFIISGSESASPIAFVYF